MRKVLFLLAIVLLMTLTTPTRAQLDQFTGNWVNSDPDTEGATRLEISQSGDELRVHAWGSCQPEDCDWGEVTGYAYGPDISTPILDGAQAISAIFETDFNSKIMVIHPREAGGLEVEVLTRFIDQSERSAFSSVYTFVRDDTLSTPVLVSPADGSRFSHFPRTTSLEWLPVDGAVSYSVEIDCYYPPDNIWCSEVDGPFFIQEGLTATIYTFDFVGAQPGRWRVWAVDRNGQEGQKSDWWVFEYSR